MTCHKRLSLAVSAACRCSLAATLSVHHVLADWPGLFAAWQTACPYSGELEYCVVDAVAEHCVAVEVVNEPALAGL